MTTAEDWQGRVGQEWARQADAMERMLAPLGLAGIDALGDVAGERVLEVGCGAGSAALELAGRGAEVTAIDLSADLLAVARAHDSAGQVAFQQADASAAVFPAPMDALYSRFGVMFFDEPVAALAHLRSQMQPNGRAVMTAWTPYNENAWAHLPMSAAKGLLPPPGPTAPGSPGPFAWADQVVFETILADAGWKQVSAEKVTRLAEIGTGDAATPTARAAAFSLRVGPLARHLRGQPPALCDIVRQRLEAAFAPFVEGDAVRLPTSAWVIRARA